MDFELDFGTVFPPDTKIPKTRIIEIQRNRSLLDNELFFDNLLSSFAKVDDVPSLYPPKSTASFKSLCTLIKTSEHLDALKKYSLIYYLLLDLPTAAHANNFASRVLLPQNFIDLITAIHHLDKLSLPAALPYLTSPTITPPIPEKVLKTLYKHGSAAMAVAFMSCVQPILESQSAVELFFSAQMELSPEGAFLYSRTTAPGYLRREFLRQLIEYCISVNPADNALKLLNLPFDEDEKIIFVETLKESSMEVARDTLVVWQMHQGHVEEALYTTRTAAARGEIGVLDWDLLGEGLKKGLGGRAGVEV